MLFVSMVSWLLLASSPSTACEAPVAPGRLSDVLSRGSYAWLVMDLDGVREAGRESRRLVQCLDAPMDPPLALAFHFQQALDAFLDRELEHVRASLEAILSIEPSWVIPESHAPGGHGLWVEFEAARAGMAEARPSLPPASHDGSNLYLVDGVAVDSPPAVGPFTLQALDHQGNLLETRYVGPGGALPMNLLPPTPAEDPRPPLPTPPTELERQLVVGSLAAGAMAVALGVYAVSEGSRLGGHLDGADQVRVRGLWTATAVLGAGSIGAGGCSLVLWSGRR